MLPPGWQHVDLLSPSRARVRSSPLAHALADAVDGTGGARLLLMRSLFSGTAGGPPLSAGVSAALAGPSTPVATAPLDAAAFGDAEVSAVSLPVGDGLRVRRVAPAAMLVGREPEAMLRVQYLLHTEHGLLTVTFTTAHAPGAGEWDQVFDAIAATCRLG